MRNFKEALNKREENKQIDHKDNKILSNNQL